jgi:ABC-type transport system substrate-binding protein
MDRKRTILLFIILLLFAGNALNYTKAQGPGPQDPIAKITIKTNGGCVKGDYALFIAQYLRDIGIDVAIKIEEWVVFLGTLFYTHNYDMGITSVYMGGVRTGSLPFDSQFLSLGSSRNIFGIGPDIPYVNQSEEILDQFEKTYDYEQKQILLNEWDELVMDKIVPFLPLYSPRTYSAIWSNTKGYDDLWGVADSLPYMSFVGYHYGQDSLDELNLHYAYLENVNPMEYPGWSNYVQEFVFEETVVMSPCNSPIKTGIINNWEQIDNYHFKFYIRDNIYWAPSYNITQRDVNSPELLSTPAVDLMRGLKNNQYSDGTNRKVTAKDAVFSYLTYANALTCDSPSKFFWISDCYADPIDELAFHIHIDGNEDLAIVEPYTEFWKDFSRLILPEFFLNSSDTSISYTEGGAECTGLYSGIEETPQWQSFDKSPFSCGPFMFDYIDPDAIAVLRRNPYWFGVGAIDGTPNLQTFVEKINIKKIMEPREALEKFLEGKLDWVDITSFSELRKSLQADSNFIVDTKLGVELQLMFFNVRRPFIGGVNNFNYYDAPGKEEYNLGAGVRKAICHAINRIEMNEVLNDGEFYLYNSLIFPMPCIIYYDDNWIYDYDLDKAIDWFVSSGYPGPADNNFALSLQNYWKKGAIGLSTSRAVLAVLVISIPLVVERKRKRIFKE